MNTLFLLATIENPFQKFGVNWYDLTSQTIAFLIIAWILNTFVFKTVMKTVADRRREAEEAVANNERIRQELKAAADAREEVLRRAQEQAGKSLADVAGFRKKVGQLTRVDFRLHALPTLEQ